MARPYGAIGQRANDVKCRVRTNATVRRPVAAGFLLTGRGGEARGVERNKVPGYGRFSRGKVLHPDESRILHAEEQGIEHRVMLDRILRATL